VAVADWLIIVRPASPKIALVARVSPENAPPMTPRNVSSVAILVATGVALAGSPSVSKSTTSMSQSSFSALHCLSASFAPSTEGRTMLALAPERAPITPILPSQAASLEPALSPVSVVPHAASARPATAVNATTCHVLDERIMDVSVVLWAVHLGSLVPGT
jgi:hypothetical protein